MTHPPRPTFPADRPEDTLTSDLDALCHQLRNTLGALEISAALVEQTAPERREAAMDALRGAAEALLRTAAGIHERAHADLDARDRDNGCVGA